MCLNLSKLKIAQKKNRGLFPGRCIDECVRAGGKCAMSAWGDWSQCSVTCGVGQRVRKRRYHNPMVDENMCGLPVMEFENCIGSSCSLSDINIFCNQHMVRPTYPGDFCRPILRMSTIGFCHKYSRLVENETGHCWNSSSDASYVYWCLSRASGSCPQIFRYLSGSQL